VFLTAINRRNLKRSILLLISITVSPFYANYTAGCGPGQDIDVYDFSMFAPEIIRQENVEPLFLTYDEYYRSPDYDGESSNNSNDTNMAEWKPVFQYALSDAELYWLLYESDLSQFERLISYYHGEDSVTFKDMIPGYYNKYARVPGTVLNHSNIRKAKKINEELQYLRLAKILEPLTYRDPFSWKPLPDHNRELDSMAPSVLKAFKKQKDKKLKARYAFQYMRILFLTGKHEKGIAFFNEDAELSPEVGSMYYRCLGYKAGMLYRLHRYAESNYLYSILYDRYAPMRFVGYFGFHPWEEEDWKNTLALAKDTREKVVLWQLFGVYADPIRAIKEIALLTPDTRDAELLLVRAVNMAEVQLLVNKPEGNYWYGPYEFESQTSYDSYASWKTVDAGTNAGLLGDIETGINNKLITVNAEVWKTSAAYLAFLLKDFEKCRFWLDEAEKHNNMEPLVRGQNDITRLALYAATLKQAGAKEEDELAKLVKKIEAADPRNILRTDNAFRYLRTALAEMYRSQSEDIKAELCKSLPARFYASLANIQRMIAYQQRRDHSEFEKFLISIYWRKLQELYKMEATAMMYQSRFNEAAAIMKRENIGMDDDLYADPFTIRIKDCIQCDDKYPEKTGYTKYGFAQKMAKLQSETINGKDRAKAAFEYANGLYNMSSYGNSRSLSYPIDFNYYGEEEEVAESEKIEEDDEDENEDNNAPHSCDEALKYYQLAMKLNSDKEFKAKCAWMSAKCEHNNWLEDGGEEGKDFEAGTYFKMMHEDFNDTEYYLQVIRECGYFSTYIRGK
jgi:hypothetical protein